MDAVARLLNVFGEATIPMLVLVAMSVALAGKVAVAERQRQRLRRQLQDALLMAARVVDASTGALLFLGRESTELFVDTVFGSASSFLLQGRLTRGAGVSGRVAEIGEAMVVADFAGDERFKQHPHREEIQRQQIASIVSVPIRVGNRLIGVMTLASDTPRNFSTESVDALRPTADQIGLLVANARIFEVTRTNWED